MKSKFTCCLIALSAFALLPIACEKHDCRHTCGDDDITVGVKKVFATGLLNPRGLKFGPDGNLYVAEAGIGGTHLYSKCTQVIPPVGPYKGSTTGSRISMIDEQGIRTTVADHLPSSTTTPMSGSSNQGIADVEFIGNTLYGLLAGAGCSHAVPGIPNGIIKVHQDKSWSIVANCSAFLMNHPVAHPDPSDFEPDGTAYSMASVNGELYITQPNQQEIDRISPSTGAISRVVDISKQYPGPTNWIGPTSMVYHDGSFYFGTLTPFPIVQGAAKVYKLSPNGQYSVFASGFTTILGIAFDNHDRLYVLENTVGANSLTPGLGRVERIDAKGKRELITSGLDLPTAMTFGPDGKLYISNWGIGPSNAGQIVQVSFKCEEVMGAQTAK